MPTGEYDYTDTLTVSRSPAAATLAADSSLLGSDFADEVRAQLRRLHEQFEIDEFVGSRSDADFLQQPLPAASRRFAVGALARFWTALETTIGPT